MRTDESSTPPLLRVRDLSVWFPKDTTFFGRPLSFIKAVTGVSFDLHRGETLGIVGESGSGKSTTAYAVLRALRPTAGSIQFCPDGTTVHELATMSQRQLRPLRREMQLVFQDPFSSLNPRLTLYQSISEPLTANGIGTKAERLARVQEVMAEVGLKPQWVNRYPQAFSGGQRQRIVIARALVLKPKMVVCDEPVSALDVSVQAQILNLMMDLKERYKLSYIFIGHDLGVMRHISDRVAVMYCGRIVETGTKQAIFDRPLHPYTQSLLASRPKLGAALAAVPLQGDVPDPANQPPGCVFHPRCALVSANCRSVVPELISHDERKVRCLLYEQKPQQAAPDASAAKVEERAHVG